MQLRHQFGHRCPLQTVDADGHALEPVDVEGIDGVLIVGQFIRGAGQTQHVARRIHQQERVLPGKRFEQFLHFRGGDIAQREQSRSEAGGRSGNRHFRYQFARDRLIGRQNDVAVALADHRVFRPGQQGFKNRQGLLLVHRLGSGKTHIAFDTLGDAVVFMQQVAHHAVDHRFDRLVGEVEDDVPAWLGASLCAGGRRWRAHKVLAAANDLPTRRCNVIGH